MPETIITIYCFLDELLKAVGHRDDPQARLTTAEIMTIALVAAELFTGNQQKALDFLTSFSPVMVTSNLSPKAASIAACIASPKPSGNWLCTF